MNSSKLFVTYSQIAVFNSDLQNPFNDWSEMQVNQGFSWRDQSVSFKTLLNDVSTSVEFNVVKKFQPLPNSIRIISVPFLCCGSGDLEVATITDAMSISIRSGLYQLIFEAGVSGHSGAWCRFAMIENGELNPEILRQDAELSPKYPLIVGCPSSKPQLGNFFS